MYQQSYPLGQPTLRPIPPKIQRSPQRAEPLTQLHNPPLPLTPEPRLQDPRIEPFLPHLVPIDLPPNICCAAWNLDPTAVDHLGLMLERWMLRVLGQGPAAPNDGWIAMELARNTLARFWRTYSATMSYDEATLRHSLLTIATHVWREFMVRQDLQAEPQAPSPTLVPLPGGGSPPSDAHAANPRKPSSRGKMDSVLAKDATTPALSPLHAEALYLREELKLSYKKICTYLGVPSGTVKSRISRARSARRKLAVTERLSA